MNLWKFIKKPCWISYFVLGRKKSRGNIRKLDLFALLGENEKCPYSISFQSSDRLNLDSWARNFMIRKYMVNGVIY